MQKTTTEVNNERYLEIMSIIEEVCKNNLSEEYLFLPENLCKEIFKLDFFENIILSTICFIVSAIMFAIIYNLIINNIPSLDYYIFTSEINLNINYLYIL